ncbi:hypothetical protein PR048_016898 [Dryococelus australis]|uniref:Uncharacterized protein n=1 Tax=Dryococelus australis TaxID=614101 RepID=A0ABQ9H7Y8_9NEOP|nr:hypothetical protein PR048_016898 [Dryococelus australis]
MLCAQVRVARTRRVSTVTGCSGFDTRWCNDSQILSQYGPLLGNFDCKLDDSECLKKYLQDDIFARFSKGKF